MKNLTLLLRAVGAALLLGSAASAQVAINKASINQESLEQSKQLYQSVSTEIDQLMARLPVTPPAAQIEHMKITNTSGRLSIRADQEAAAGNWPQAESDYQQALTLYPYEEGALYALGDHKLRQGDLKAAVNFYRQAIYERPANKPPLASGPVFHEANAFRLMEYARLLSLTGQQEEAQTVYRRGAHFLNYMDGQQHLPLMLPDLGDGPGQIQFTPARLQALALVGWAEDHADFDQAGAWARLQQAVALYPDSPVPYFFRGRHEARYAIDYQAAAADLKRAGQLAGGTADEAVQKEMHLFRAQINGTPAAGHAPKPKQPRQ